MATFVKGVRASREEWTLFTEAAAASGLTVNAWIRRTLKESAEGDLAELRERAAKKIEREELQAAIYGPIDNVSFLT